MHKLIIAIFGKQTEFFAEYLKLFCYLIAKVWRRDWIIFFSLIFILVNAHISLENKKPSQNPTFCGKNSWPELFYRKKRYGISCQGSI